MRLRFRPRPTPPLDELSELLREQLGPLLEQAEEDGPDGAELIDLFDVLDEGGQHLYDLHLFCGDDGQLHRTGTTEHVASFSQGGPTGTDDDELLGALAAAYAEWANASRPAERTR
jgi:hypothetical protein